MIIRLKYQMIQSLGHQSIQERNQQNLLKNINVGNQEARYIKVTINDYSATSEGVTWGNCIYI